MSNGQVKKIHDGKKDHLYQSNNKRHRHFVQFQCGFEKLKRKADDSSVTMSVAKTLIAEADKEPEEMSHFTEPK